MSRHVKAVNGDHVPEHLCAPGPDDPSCCAACGGPSMTWEAAIVVLAQGVVNVTEMSNGQQRGCFVAAGSPIHRAMITLLEHDLGVKQGSRKLPSSWAPAGAHLAGYERKIS